MIRIDSAIRMPAAETRAEAQRPPPQLLSYGAARPWIAPTGHLAAPGPAAGRTRHWPPPAGPRQAGRWPGCRQFGEYLGRGHPDARHCHRGGSSVRQGPGRRRRECLLPAGRAALITVTDSDSLKLGKLET